MIFQNLELHNIQEVSPASDGDGWNLRRVPASLWAHLNPGAQRQAFSPAGAELRFNLADGAAKIILKYVEDRGVANRGWPVLAEIHHGDFYSEWVEIRSEWTEIIVKPASSLHTLEQMVAGKKSRFPPSLLRVVLPYMPEIRLKAIEGAVSLPKIGEVPVQRYLAYGSSITNGAFVTRPGDTYPARVAQKLSVDHLNLGFGAGAFLEPEMGAWIAERTDWDIASLELGTNLLGRITAEQFAQHLDAFLGPILSRHRDKWIFCIDLFSTANDVRGEPKPETFRSALRASLQKLAGTKVVYVDGRHLLPDPSGLILDLVHPSSEGAETIAQRLFTLMSSLIST